MLKHYFDNLCWNVIREVAIVAQLVQESFHEVFLEDLGVCFYVPRSILTVMSCMDQSWGSTSWQVFQLFSCQGEAFFPFDLRRL